MNLGTIEPQWIVQVKEAQAQYRKALDHHQQMAEELDLCLRDGANGSFHIARAMHALAFNELIRCQESLVNLVLRSEVSSQRLDQKVSI
jgi:hypothetical protein